MDEPSLRGRKKTAGFHPPLLFRCIGSQIVAWVKPSEPTSGEKTGSPCDDLCLMLRSAERASRSIQHSSFETPRLARLPGSSPGQALRTRREPNYQGRSE